MELLRPRRRGSGIPGFEAAPAFIDLPLGSGAMIAATQEVPAGLYTALKFEAEDVDFARTGEVLKFEARMEDGFTKVEIDD